MADHSLIQRSRMIHAAPDRIVPLLADYQEWRKWSPWEDLDPDLHRSYGGPDSGVGSWYEWSGNRQAGAGRMEVTGVTDTTVDMDLQFTKPFKSANVIHFELVPNGDVTTVVWSMEMPRTLMTRIVGLFMNFDKRVGADLDKGLARLQKVAESPA